MSFSISKAGKPAEVVRALRADDAWFRAATCWGGKEAADFAAMAIETVTAENATVSVDANGHIDGDAASVTMTIRTYR